MHRLLVVLQAIAPAIGYHESYWKSSDGSPRPVAVPQKEISEVRKQYMPDSPKWRRLPKSFVIEPSSCANASGTAVGAFSARYNFGWTKAESNVHNIAHQAAQSAVRSFSPQHYYQDPLHRASASGMGSDLGVQTEADRTWLIEIIRRFNVTTMIDVPCGDVNWQLGAWETDSLTAYIGLDIVPHLIELNAARFAHHSNKQFAPWDFAACALPQIVWPKESPQPPDLVHARHVLNHMPTARAAKAAYHLVTSGARLVVTSGAYTEQKQRPAAQKNVREGEMWENNMAAAPFFFPAPTSCNNFGMCAWEFDDESRALWKARFRKLSHEKENGGQLSLKNSSKIAH